MYHNKVHCLLYHVINSILQYMRPWLTCDAKFADGPNGPVSALTEFILIINSGF